MIWSWKYLFFSSSSFFGFSVAPLRPFDVILGVGDLGIGDKEEELLRLLCLLRRLGVGDLLLGCLEDGERLLRRCAELDRLALLHEELNIQRYLLKQKGDTRRLQEQKLIVIVSISQK